MKQLDIPKLLRLLKRRKLVLTLPVVVAVGAAVAAYRVLPPRYEATTTIMVEQQQIPSDYVRSTVSTTAKERLQTIEQQVNSRAALQLIIDELNLYPELRDAEAMEKLVQRARGALSVRVERGTVFSISFKSTDPKMAAAAANKVAEHFIEENLRLRESQARNTSAFLTTEVAQLRDRVDAKQEAILAFRRRNEGLLPEQRLVLVQGIDQLEKRLEINRAEQQDAELRKLVLETSEGIPTAKRSASPRRARLRELEGELARLRLQYTDRHPDVRRLVREIEILEKEIAGGEPTNPAESPTDADPAVLLEIQSLDQDIQRLQEERHQIIAKIADYQARLEAMPRVEQELSRLTNEYENLHGTFESLQAKQVEAQLAENLEKSQQAEQFRMLDRALPPTEPYFPNLLLFLGLGLVSGAGVGIGLALIREHGRETFADGEALQAAYPGVEIMASIPFIPEVAEAPSRADRSAERRSA